MPLVTELPENLETIHIMGVGGTAMAALAGLLVDAGHTVTGSDGNVVYPPMSDVLTGLGIEPMVGFEASNLDHDPDLVVIGNVVRKTYPEAEAVLARDLPYTSFPGLLGARFLAGKRNLVVSGTHGKTTTTSLMAWLLESAGRRPGFLVGGVPLDFDRTARAAEGDHFVIEGDEYDTAFFDKGPKFVHYRPQTAIITSIEFDHADIYRDVAHIQESFRKLVAIVPEGGCIVARWDQDTVVEVCRPLVEARAEVLAAARAAHEERIAALPEGAEAPALEVPEPAVDIRRYGPGQQWDGRVEGVDPATGTMRFTVTCEGQDVGTFESILVGEHNLYNQVAAVAALLREGLTVAELQEGFRTFRGIKRRQEIRGEPGGVTVVDDFAHHPTAVRLTLGGLRQRFGGRRLWAIFEPRSNTSRRNVFQREYAEAFDDCDVAVVAPPRNLDRIPEAERFDAEALVGELRGRGREAFCWGHGPDDAAGADAIVAQVVANCMPEDVVAVLSNGGFGGLHDKLLAALEERFASRA